MSLDKKSINGPSIAKSLEKMWQRLERLAVPLDLPSRKSKSALRSLQSQNLATLSLGIDRRPGGPQKLSELKRSATCAAFWLGRGHKQASLGQLKLWC
jgi:hypothetical protein